MELDVTTPAPPPPFVGAVLLYWDKGHEPGELVPSPAIVTAIEGERLHLFVMFAPFAAYTGHCWDNRIALYSDTPKRGHWCWPGNG